MTLAHVCAAIGLLAGSAALALVIFRLVSLFPITKHEGTHSRFITTATVYAGMTGLTLLVAMIGYMLFNDDTRALPLYPSVVFGSILIVALMMYIRKNFHGAALLLAIIALALLWLAPIFAGQVSEPINKYELVRFYDGYISYDGTRSQLVTFTIKIGKGRTLVYSMLEYKPENKREMSEGIITFDENELVLKIDENPPCRVKKSIVKGEKKITLRSVGKEFPRYTLTSMKEVSQ